MTDQEKFDLVARLGTKIEVLGNALLIGLSSTINIQQKDTPIQKRILKSCLISLMKCRVVMPARMIKR